MLRIDSYGYPNSSSWLRMNGNDWLSNPSMADSSSPDFAGHWRACICKTVRMNATAGRGEIYLSPAVGSTLKPLYFNPILHSYPSCCRWISRGSLQVTCDPVSWSATRWDSQDNGRSVLLFTPYVVVQLPSLLRSTTMQMTDHTGHLLMVETNDYYNYLLLVVIWWLVILMYKSPRDVHIS